MKSVVNIRDGDLELASADFPNIRLMTVPLAASPTPLDDFPRYAGDHPRTRPLPSCRPTTMSR